MKIFLAFKGYEGQWFNIHQLNVNINNNKQLELAMVFMLVVYKSSG